MDTEIFISLLVLGLKRRDRRPQQVLWIFLLSFAQEAVTLWTNRKYYIKRINCRPPRATVTVYNNINRHVTTALGAIRRMGRKSAGVGGVWDMDSQKFSYLFKSTHLLNNLQFS